MKGMASMGFKRSSGYTVIELIIALTLLVTAMIPLAVLLSTSLRTTSDTSAHLQARQIATSEIDKVRSLNFDAIGLSTATTSFYTAINGQQVRPEAGYPGLYPGPETRTVESEHMSFAVTRDVRMHVNNGAETKKVIITVSWDAPEPAGSVEIPTLIGPTEMTTD